MEEKLHPITQKLRRLTPNHQEEEIWKSIDGFSRYKVSNFGRVKSFVRHPIILKSARSAGSKKFTSGSQVILCSDEGIHRVFLVRRLVATAFIPNTKNLPYVTHIDKDVTNNHVSNLKWSDRKGENNYKAKLTNDEASEILYLVNSGVPLKEIAKKFNVNKNVVSGIKRGESFRFLEINTPRKN